MGQQKGKHEISVQWAHEIAKIKKMKVNTQVHVI